MVFGDHNSKLKDILFAAIPIYLIMIKCHISDKIWVVTMDLSYIHGVMACLFVPGAPVLNMFEVCVYR